MSFEFIRILILSVGWPVLVVGGSYLLYRAWSLYRAMGKTSIALITPILSLAVVVTMISLGLVATAFLYVNLNESISWILPIFLVWAVIMIVILIMASRYEVRAKEYNDQQLVLKRAQDDFLAMMSHQLRTPLSGMRWTLSSLIKNTSLNKDVLKKVHDIEKANSRLIYLVNNILSSIKLETGQMNVVKKSISLSCILDDVTHELEPLALQKQITINSTINLDNDILTTDKVLLFEVIHNLVDNAIKYGEKSSEIQIRVDKGFKKDVVLSVINQGPVIPVDKQKYLFDKFSREEHKGKELIQNIGGFGLFIARSFIELLGGSITVYSSEKTGTIFSINIPRN